MNDFSRSTLPRETPLGREVYIEQRASSNRAAIFAIAGLLVLCVCLCVGIGGVGYFFLGPQTGTSSGLKLPSFDSATAVPTRSAEATPVPFLKSGKDDSGLRLTVTAYQRPLPAQDIKIPAGQELVLVSVKIENIRATGGPLKYSADDFKLVSPDGDQFSADTGSITTGEMLKKGEVGPGKTAKGDLVFYVYSDIEDLQLAWTSADGATRLFAVTRGK